MFINVYLYEQFGARNTDTLQEKYFFHLRPRKEKSGYINFIIAFYI